jgi:hypothetical protein
MFPIAYQQTRLHSYFYIPLTGAMQASGVKSFAHPTNKLIQPSFRKLGLSWFAKLFINLERGYA